MANMTPINIQVDEEAIKEQVSRAIQQIVIDVSMKLRVAADSLDPGFLAEQNKWLEEEIERRVEAKLKGENNG